MNVKPNPQVEELGRRKVSFAGIRCIPKNIQQLLENDWENPDCLDWLLCNSEVCRILRKDPASSMMLNFAYFGQFLNGAEPTRFDHWLRGRKSADALRNRLDYVGRPVVEELWKLPSAKIVDFGSGPGEYARKAWLAMPGARAFDDISWRCIELDELCNAYGRIKSRLFPFKTSFELANFMKPESYPVPEEAADLGLLIGVLCGMTPEQAVKLLIAIKPHFKPKGELIAATLLTKAFEEDPQSFRVYCNVLGWQLRPKTIEEVKEIFDQAGWLVENITSEHPTGDGQYAVVHCRLVF